MSEYLDRFAEWRRKAKEKAKELDEKYNISETVGETVKAAEKIAGEAMQTGGKVTGAVKDAASDIVKEVSARIPDSVSDSVSNAVNTVRDEIHKIDEDGRVTDNLKRAAEDAAKAGAEALRTGAEKVSEVADRANEVAEKATSAYESVRSTARGYYDKAETAYSAGAKTTKAATATVKGVRRAQKWVVANPGASAIIGLSLVAGIRIGSAFPNLDKVVFGTSRHWLFHSGAAAYGARKLSEKYFAYLKEQSRLLAEGKLTEAERERLRFQRKVARYVGAPLLGAFNVALGTTLWAEIFSPKRIVGFPISIVLGGNPVLETVWLFGNGLVCIYNGYQLVMFALEDQDDVQRIIREIKGLLPEDSSDRNSNAA
jgi:hypothetical protein